MFPILPLLVTLLIFASAALAASETAIFVLARMEHTREQLSRPVRIAIERLMHRPLETLIVVIGLSETANVFAECLATIFLLLWLGNLGAYIAAPLMLVTVLLLCDITPKTFALGHPGGVARLTARPLAVLASGLPSVARYVTAPPAVARPEPVSEAEFKELLRIGESHGAVGPEERAMIHRVFDFGTRRASEVMTPRERIFSLDIDQPDSELITAIAHGHFSRVPVYRRTQGNVIGILHAKDLVARRLEAAPARIERLVRPAYFIPPHKALGELFDEMRRGRFQMALVVDEYGGLLGLVTLEDLLEELFGEIRDEFELEVPEFTRVGEGEFVVSGAIQIESLNKALGGEPRIEAAGSGRTLSSLVLRKLGRVPRAGEKLKLGDYEATVERARGATVELVRLKR
ncbi:MAG TPA: hemolysin family protein [Candidatus Binataceae bacterium]|nr:hemolysin family protein [Candidatus Binataceae bacterium]